jgi:hypothetical protein
VGARWPDRCSRQWDRDGRDGEFIRVPHRVTSTAKAARPATGGHGSDL